MTTALTLHATTMRLCTDDTLEALRAALVPAHIARSEDLVTLSSSFQLDEPDDIPWDRDVELWSLQEDRLMPQQVAKVPAEHKANASIAFALLCQDQMVRAPVMTAARAWKSTPEGSVYRIFLVYGGAIVQRVVANLALRTRTDLQDHLDKNMKAFLVEGLSNHDRIPVVASLSALASDLATWGTSERHFEDPEEITHHSVAVQTG